MARAERERWDALYREGSGGPGDPSPFLIGHAADIPDGRALDIATGRGRHALWLARRGLRVHAIDISETAARGLAEIGSRQHLVLSPIVADLESFPLPIAAYDVVINVNFLHRPLFPALVGTLRPGGILVFETFLAAQAAHGHPKNPAHLLAPGELRAGFADRLAILDYREGPVERDGTTTHLASLLARRNPRAM
jgi:SAM-dependent methyltransferase